MFLLSNSQAIWESFEKQLHIIAFNIFEHDMIEKGFRIYFFPHGTLYLNKISFLFL